MVQFQLALDGPVAAVPERRIDVTLARLAANYETLSDAERALLTDKPWFIAIETVFQLRSMERGEEEVLSRSAAHSVADIYDRIVAPGEHVGEALLRVYRAMFTTSE